MTLKHWLITGALAAAAIPAGAELYRWVDASGTVHYSDTPREGAEKITLRPTNVIPSRPARTVATPRTRDAQEPEPTAPEYEPYLGATIVSPTEDQVLWNIGAKLTVDVRVEPALQEGHGIVLIYDGRPVNDQPVASTSITIDNVFRGQHSVRASIRDADNNSLYEGGSITFYVQQTSIN